MSWEKSLKSMVGAQGYETLRKAIYRKDSDSEIGPLDIYMPLMVVPRAILSWLSQNIKPLEINEEKRLVFPGMPDTQIDITKTGRDSYRASFLKDGKVIHQFDKQTLPNVGGHIMTVGEIYDFEDEKTGHTHDLPTGGHTEGPESQEESDAEDTLSPDISVPTKIMSMMGGITPPKDTDGLKWESINTLTGAIGKLVDALICNQMVRNNVEETITLSLGKEQKKEAPQKTAPCETEVRKLSVKKAAPQEGPSGQAVPDKPKGILLPKKPSREQQPRVPLKPITNKDYFKNRLNKCNKTEKKEYHVLEQQLYTACPHCDVPEFQKTESGPKYKPCACFYVTLKTEEGKATSFVRVMKKNEGGYSLVFNKNADPETINAFLLTLKNKLIKQRNNMS